MQPQQGGSWRSPDDGSSNQKRTAGSKKVRRTTSGAILPQSSGSPSSRGSTASSRARNQFAASNLAGLFRTNVDVSSHPVAASATTNSSSRSLASGGTSRRWTADTDASSVQAKAQGRLAAVPQGRHTADVLSKSPGHGARRTISLEARAAPPNQAEPAPISTSRSDGKTDGDAAQQAELDESPHVPTGVTNGDDIFQSAEDELEPNNVRAKTNAQATTRGSPEMVARWDSQQAMKPPAFDQDDYVTSVDGLLDIAVTSRGGRLNSGWKKENQDKFMLQMNREDGWTVMGVFDGHGMWGGKVASAVRDGMVRAMKDVDGRKMNGSDPGMALRNAFDYTNSELEASALDLTRSGTTAVLSIVTSDWVMTAWAGDSRMVLGRQATNEDSETYMEAIELSQDHKPDNPEECKRIVEAGGRVDRLVSDRTKEPVGPFRVYLQYAWSPGLACSRAFGDKMAVEVGVTHKPDVTMHTFEPEDQYMIMASDGVWELISSQEAVEIVAEYPDSLEQGRNQLLQVARERWAAIQGGRTCDDITAIVVKLKKESTQT